MTEVLLRAVSGHKGAGWGIEVGPDTKKRCTIKGITDGCPASKAGLKIGDRISAIGRHTIAPGAISLAQKLIKGLSNIESSTPPFMLQVKRGYSSLLS